MKTILLILSLFLVGINSQAQSTNSGGGVNLDTNKPAGLEQQVLKQLINKWRC